jgi:hypothetical protein
VKTWNDLITKDFTVGGEGSGSDPDVYALLLKNAFGAKLKLISGYPGTAEIADCARTRRGRFPRKLVWTEPEDAQAELDRGEEGQFSGAAQPDPRGLTCRTCRWSPSSPRTTSSGRCSN